MEFKYIKTFFRSFEETRLQAAQSGDERGLHLLNRMQSLAQGIARDNLAYGLSRLVDTLHDTSASQARINQFLEIVLCVRGHFKVSAPAFVIHLPESAEADALADLVYTLDRGSLGPRHNF